MSKILCLLLCVACVTVVSAQGPRNRRSATGSGGGAGASSYSSSGSGSGSGSGTGNFMFPGSSGNPYGGYGMNPYHDFNAMFQQFFRSLSAAQNYAAQNPDYAAIFNQQIGQLMALQQQALAQNPLAFPGFGVDSNYIAPEVRTSGANPVYTGASVNYGHNGGYGEAASFPGGSDGLGVRIAEEFPAPSGGSFGVFTSSSSGTSDVNGKRTSFKSSTFGTNDNGKITFKTVNE